MAWDRYAYSIGNPLHYNDPSGHSIGDVIGQFSTGLVYEFALRNAWMSSQAQEVLRVSQTESDAMIVGRIVGDILTAFVALQEIEAGIGIAGGGVVACGTGVLCVVTPEAIAVGAGVAAVGAATATSASVGLGENLAMLSGNGEENNSNLSSELFEENGIRTSDHFLDRMDDWGISEEEAFNIYQNGDKYTDAQGRFIIYDPKTKLAIGVDKYDKGAITIFEQTNKPRSWESGWLDPEEFYFGQ